MTLKSPRFLYREVGGPVLDPAERDRVDDRRVALLRRALVLDDPIVRERRGKSARILVELTASLFGRRILDRPTRSA